MLIQWLGKPDSVRNELCGVADAWNYTNKYQLETYQVQNWGKNHRALLLFRVTNQRNITLITETIHWNYLIVYGVIHLKYFRALIRSYNDFVYPIKLRVEIICIWYSQYHPPLFNSIYDTDDELYFQKHKNIRVQLNTLWTWWMHDCPSADIQAPQLHLQYIICKVWITIHHWWYSAVSKISELS